jgi:DNA-binding transcriptional regulator YhcF (GntR family)
MLHKTTKYKQIVNYVLNEINEGALSKGSWLPSVNDFRLMFNLSRDTVFAGIAELKSKGVIESCPGKGYYVCTSRPNVEHNILLLFNEMNSFKQRLYNSLTEGLGNDDNVDIQFHNYNRRVFETLLREANGKYDTFVIMSGKFQGLEPLLKSLSGRVLLLDHYHSELRGKFSGVAQNFEEDTYNALVYGKDALAPYTYYYMIQSEMKEPYERYNGMKRFCEERGLKHKYLTSVSIRKIKRGDLFIVANDTDMVELLKLADAQNLTPGKEFGLISYNDTPLKEILAGGITTLSTDFSQMGKTMAKLIRKREIEVVDNPWKLEIRASI